MNLEASSNESDSIESEDSWYVQREIKYSIADEIVSGLILDTLIDEEDTRTSFRNQLRSFAMDAYDPRLSGEENQNLMNLEVQNQFNAFLHVRGLTNESIAETTSLDEIKRYSLDQIATLRGIDPSEVHEDWLNLFSHLNNGDTNRDAICISIFGVIRYLNRFPEFDTNELLRHPVPPEFWDIDDFEMEAEYLRIMYANIQQTMVEDTDTIVGNANLFSEEDLARAAYLELNILALENHPEADLTIEDALLLAQTTTNPEVLAILKLVPGSTDITRAIVTNPAVTREILVSIANSSNVDERIELALNTDNKEILIILCSDVDEVKLFIATERIEHPDYGELAEELFWSTIGTENIYEPISTNVIANLLFRSINHGNVENLVIDHMSELPTEILVLLAEVSRNRDTLDRLAASTTDWEILREIIGNRSTRLETQQAILQGELDRI